MRRLFIFSIFLLSLFTLKAHDNTNEAILEKIDSLSEVDFILADSLIKAYIASPLYIDNSDLMHALYYRAARLHKYEGFYEEAEAYYEHAIEIVDQTRNYSKSIKYRLSASHNALDQGDLNEAIKIGINANEIAIDNKDSLWIARTYNNIAEAYRFFDQLDLSFSYNQKALTIGRKLNDEHIYAMIYNNMAVILGEMGKNEEAIDTLENALELLGDSNFFARAKFNSNLGFCYRNLGDFTLALKHHKIALDFKIQAKMKESYGYSFGAIGRAYDGLGILDSAIFYTLKEYKHAIDYKDPYQLKDAAIHVANAYHTAQDYENAFYYLNIGCEMEDSLYDAEIEQSSLLYQRKYDLSQKEREIEQLKVLQDLSNSRQRIVIITLLSLLVVALLIATIFRLRGKRKEQERKMAELKLEVVEKENVQNRNALKEFTAELMAKNKGLKELNEKLLIKEKELQSLREGKSEELEQLSEIKLLTEQDWIKFKQLFEKVYPDFFERLNMTKIDFTKGEKRLMSLIKLDMEIKEIADTLGISAESVSKSRFRLKKKLSENSNDSIESFVHQL